MSFPSESIVPPKRMHSKDASISEIDGNGERVAVLCTVVDFDAGAVEGKIDDGSGVALFVLEDVLFAEKMRSGALVRIVGRAYKSEEGLLIRVELVQDMGAVDPTLYNKVRELERRAYDETGV